MAWIDLPDVKAHLNKTGTSDDGELPGFIDAACAMIEDLTGHVDPVAVTQALPAHRINEGGTRGYWYGGYHRDWIVVLPEVPVASVQSVTFDPGDAVNTSVVARDVVAGVDVGWWLQDNVLHVPQRTGWYGAYTVAYTAGRDPVPGNFRMAALELVAHLWKTTQMGASGGPMQSGEPDISWERGMSYALPFRVRELLGLYGNSIPSPGVILA